MDKTNLEKPLVSVLMTAYNREKYIADAIESVLASSYKNFELIIVDDGSKDKTVEIARSYEVRDTRVRVYVNEANLGDYPNRNKAAGYAKGKYLKYIDADDTIYPWGLDILVSVMEKFPGSKWGLCSLDQFKDRPFPFELLPAEAYEYHYFGPSLFHKAPLSSIIDRTAFEEIGGFKKIRMAGDFEMWHRLAEKYPVTLMPHGIVWSREHQSQEMNQFNMHRFSYNRVRLHYLRHGLCPLKKNDRQKLLSREMKLLVKELIKSCLKLELRDARQYYDLLFKYKWLDS